MAKDSPSQLMPKVQIRITEDLQQKIMQAAYKADRSVNAEIVARLEASFGAPEVVFSEAQEEEIRRVAKEIATELLMKVEEKMREDDA